MGKKEDMENTLTPEQAAQRLGVDSSTVRNWIRKGVLPAQRVGLRGYRILISDIDKMIQPTSAKQKD